MNNQIRIFENDDFNVKVRINEKGEYEFDAETVAISLGITTIAKSGNVCIRWNRVNEYLKKYLSQNIAKGSYIIEPLVYKLAFKANNEVAERFQDWLAYEVLPTLRKTGTYTNTTYQYAVSPAAGAAAAELGRVTRNIMRDQGSSPYKIAATFKLECEQLGIELPADFVEIPVYQQLSFQDTIIG